jgi:hypothetical protein
MPCSAADAPSVHPAAAAGVPRVDSRPPARASPRDLGHPVPPYPTLARVLTNGRHSSDTKARIAPGVARYHTVRRESGRILPSDLLSIGQGKAGTRAVLRSHVADSAAELAALAVRRRRARGTAV